MKKIYQIFGLKKEALLLDSKLYIVKSLLAVATGYIVGRSMPIARIDMISVLLGVMYNLEPINIVGVKGGIQQLAASTIGAACTSILIILFGINVFTVSISMALTLFISLKINWRMVSPVAIFTSIYMTQFIQSDSLGNPSVWLTFRLRIVALGLGILIAVLYNYIFSFFYYRKIAYKRLQYAKLQLVSGLNYTVKQLENKDEGKGREYITLFPAIFNDLDLIYSNIETMISESKYSISLLKPEKLKSIGKILKYFRDINHLAYDINFNISGAFECDEIDPEVFDRFKKAVNEVNKLDLSFGSNSTNKPYSIDKTKHADSESKTVSRINENMNLICRYIDMAIFEISGLQ